MDHTVIQLGLLFLIHYLLVLLVKLDIAIILEGVEGQCTRKSRGWKFGR